MLGNRLTMGSNSYGWDQLYRMKSYNSTSYTYRADAMRTYKTNSSGSTSYRYDGQMGMEDIDYSPNGAVLKVTDYGVGARGIDAIYVAQNGTSTASYPIYDAHGNMISTLSRQGTGYGTAAIRTVDAWGQIRVGAQTGDPKSRYCANLGHKQDDESGLIYMRARYYEATSGRFISQDSKQEGSNWFAYCNCDPLNNVDRTGKSAESEIMAWIGSLLIYLGGILMGVGALFGAVFLNDTLAVETKVLAVSKNLDIGYVEVLDAVMEEVDAGTQLARSGFGASAWNAIIGYSIMLVGALLYMDSEFVDPYSANMGAFGGSNS